jgi:hypothetical protein
MIWLAILGLALNASQGADGRAALAPAQVEENGLRQLLSITRVYVDRLTGGETAAQFRDILISSLEGSKLFILTENQDRADVTLRGAAEDLVFTDVHSASDSVNARVNLSTGRTTSASRGPAAGIGVGESESDHSTERRHEAIAAVRLVNKDGDVIWSTTQESLGARFRGASADVADKITGRLKEDYDKARKLGKDPARAPRTPAAGGRNDPP